MSKAGFKNNPLYSDITKLDHLSPQPVFSYEWNLESGRWQPSSNSTVSIDESLKLLTKTSSQKIEESFILMENIPDDVRLGTYTGVTYGTDRFIMDDIFNTHYENGRLNPSTPETGHPDYFIISEDTDPNRGHQQDGAFDTDTAHGLRFDDKKASSINSYEIEDFSKFQNSGTVDSITIYNESFYPLQFHITNHTTEYELDSESSNLIFLDPNTSVTIEGNEAEKIFIKRRHTISGYSVKYSLTYRDQS